MEFIQIKNKETGRELTITCLEPILFRKRYTVTGTGREPVVVPVRSIGKVIRTWMKEKC